MVTSHQCEICEKWCKSSEWVMVEWNIEKEFMTILVCYSCKEVMEKKGYLTPTKPNHKGEKELSLAF